MSTVSGTVTADPTIVDPAVELGIRLVKPVNNALHRGYIFYLKVTSTGVNTILVPADTTAWFGPYEMRVGCYPGTLTWTDHVNFVT